MTTALCRFTAVMLAPYSFHGILTSRLRLSRRLGHTKIEPVLKLPQRPSQHLKPCTGATPDRRGRKGAMRDLLPDDGIPRSPISPDRPFSGQVSEIAPESVRWRDAFPNEGQWHATFPQVWAHGSEWMKPPQFSHIFNSRVTSVLL